MNRLIIRIVPILAVFIFAAIPIARDTSHIFLNSVIRPLAAAEREPSKIELIGSPSKPDQVGRFTGPVSAARRTPTAKEIEEFGSALAWWIDGATQTLWINDAYLKHKENGLSVEKGPSQTEILDASIRAARAILQQMSREDYETLAVTYAKQHAQEAIEHERALARQFGSEMTGEQLRNAMFTIYIRELILNRLANMPKGVTTLTFDDVMGLLVPGIRDNAARSQALQITIDAAI